MVLILDFRHDESRVLLASKNEETKSFNAGRGTGFFQLGLALDSLIANERPRGIAVVMQDQNVDAHMSWSTVRAVVSMANSLGFAWNVPVVRITGDKGDDLVIVAMAALKDAESNVRISALYDGEPNITKPK